MIKWLDAGKHGELDINRSTTDPISPNKRHVVPSAGLYSGVDANALYTTPE